METWVENKLLKERILQNASSQFWGNGLSNFAEKIIACSYTVASSLGYLEGQKYTVKG